MLTHFSAAICTFNSGMLVSNRKLPLTCCLVKFLLAFTKFRHSRLCRLSHERQLNYTFSHHRDSCNCASRTKVGQLLYIETYMYSHSEA